MSKLEPCDNIHYQKSFTDKNNSSNELPSQMNIKLEPPDPINYEESNLQSSDFSVSLSTLVKSEPSIELDEEHTFNSNSCSTNVSILSETGKNDNDDDGNSDDSFHLTWDDDMLKGEMETSEDSDAQNKVHEEVERTNIFGISNIPWKIKIENVESEITSAKKKCTKRRRRKKLNWNRKKSKPSYFKCTYCIRSFCTQELLDIHLNIHNETILVCSYCNFGSTSNYSMTHHVKHVHNLHSLKIGVDYFRKNQTEAEQVCNRKEEFNDKLTDDSCEVKIKSEACLSSPDIKREIFTNDCLGQEPVQQELNSSKSDDRGKDENCNLEMFSSCFEFLLNQKFKKNLDNCELQCFSCLLILDTLPRLMVHIFRNHFVPKLFKCNICKYLGYFPLIFHPVVKSKHECSEISNEKTKLKTRSVTAPFESNPCTNEGMPVANRFRCGLCGFLPASIRSITSHMRAVHCQLKQFHCKYCDLKIYYPLVILEKAALHQCKHNSIVNTTVNNCSKSNDEKNLQITNIKSTFTKSKNSEMPKKYCCIKCGFCRTVTAKRWKYLEHRHICIDGNNIKDRKGPQELKDLNKPRTYSCIKCGFSRTVTAKRWKYLEHRHICVDGNNIKDRKDPQELKDLNKPRTYSCIKCGFSRTVTAKRWKYLEHRHICVDGNNRKDSKDPQELKDLNKPRTYSCIKCGFSRTVTAKRWKYLEHRHTCVDGNNRKEPQELKDLNKPRMYRCIKCNFSRRATNERWKFLIQNHNCVGRFLKTDFQEIHQKIRKLTLSETEKKVQQTKNISNLKINKKSCEKCGFRSKRWRYLKHHHVCIDKKNRKDSQGLQKNIRTRPKEKMEFKCGHCDYVAMSEKNLYTHTLTHCNKNFLTCKHCPYSSFGVTSMRKHVKTFHNEDNEGLPEVTDVVNSPSSTGIERSFVKNKVNGEGRNSFDVNDDDNESTDSSPEVADFSNSQNETRGIGKRGAKDKVTRKGLNPIKDESTKSKEKRGAKDKVTREKLNDSNIPDQDDSTETASETEEFKVNTSDMQGCTYQNKEFDAESDHNYFLSTIKRKCNFKKSCATTSPLQTKPSTYNSSIETNTAIVKEQCSVSSVIEEKVESNKAVKKTVIPLKKTTAVKKRKVTVRSRRRLKSKLEDNSYSFAVIGVNDTLAKLKNKPYSFVSGIDESVLPTISFTEEAPTPGGNQHLKDAWDKLTFDYPDNDFNDPQEDPLAVEDNSSKGEIITNTKQIIWKRKKTVYMSHDLDIPEEHKVQRELYGCEVCEKLYYNKMEIARHREEHDRLLCINDKEDGIFDCPFCNFTTLSKPSLRWHKFKHHAVSVSYFSCCPICSYTVESNDLMSDHIYRDHSCGTISKCILCEHDYNKILITHDHRALMGLSDNTCCCEVCSDVFHSRQDFLLHVLDNHSNNNS